MHTIHTLVILLLPVAGVVLLFLLTARLPRGNEPDDPPPPRPVCPVDPGQRAWIERSLLWCAREFGEAAALRPIVLPTADLLPTPYDASEFQIHQIYRRISPLMGVDPDKIELRLRERLDQGPPSDQAERGDRRIVGRYRSPRYLRLRWFDAKIYLGRHSIEIERAQTADPARLIALLAHELAHRRLLGEGRVTAAQPDQERLTDLLTIYLGLGLFTANLREGIEGHLGYLTAAERGYALACYCRMRAEFGVPGWANRLHPEPRALLAQSLAFLAFEAAGPADPDPPR